MAAQGHKIQAEPYRWPLTTNITKDNTALVIIDMQRDCKAMVH
jgi:hypothetical protein